MEANGALGTRNKVWKVRQAREMQTEQEVRKARKVQTEREVRKARKVQTALGAEGAVQPTEWMTRLN